MQDQAKLALKWVNSFLCLISIYFILLFIYKLVLLLKITGCIVTETFLLINNIICHLDLFSQAEKHRCETLKFENLLVSFRIGFFSFFIVILVWFKFAVNFSIVFIVSLAINKQHKRNALPTCLLWPLFYLSSVSFNDSVGIFMCRCAAFLSYRISAQRQWHRHSLTVTE